MNRTNITRARAPRTGRVTAGTAIMAVALGLLAGCGRAQPAPLVPHPVAATTTVDPAAPCRREAPAGSADTAPAPAGTVAVFDRAAQKIVLSAGTGARDGATMTVDHAEIRYLGYADVQAYGLAWRTSGTTGRVTDSIISNLYFGVYTYEIAGLVVTGNEVYSNAVYGIDPHTASHNMTITHNVVHDNGKHGIILAEDCADSVISDNVVYGNQGHGIVLYLRSDRNTVTRNESFGNGSQGINVNESDADTISDNRVYANGESGIGIGEQAQGNTVEGNNIRANQQDGVRLVTRSADTTVRDNIIGQNVRYSVYADVAGPFALTGNTIYSSRFGLAVTGGAPTPPETANTMFSNADGNIRGLAG